MDSKDKQKFRQMLQIKVPDLPQKYEQIIKKVFGPEWRSLSQTEIEGALGIAICKAILVNKRSSFNLDDLSREIGVEAPLLSIPYERLAKNGYMKDGRIKGDQDLLKEDMTAWCYIAGTASGLTGNVL